MKIGTAWIKKGQNKEKTLIYIQYEKNIDLFMSKQNSDKNKQGLKTKEDIEKPP